MHTRMFVVRVGVFFLSLFRFFCLIWVWIYRQILLGETKRLILFSKWIYIFHAAITNMYHLFMLPMCLCVCVTSQKMHNVYCECASSVVGWMILLWIYLKNHQMPLRRRCYFNHCYTHITFHDNVSIMFLAHSTTHMQACVYGAHTYGWRLVCVFDACLCLAAFCHRENRLGSRK